jgi:SAM-dependent methyltransferase
VTHAATELVRAIQRTRAPAWAAALLAADVPGDVPGDVPPDDRALARRVVSASRSIATAVDAERVRLVSELEAHGCPARSDGPDAIQRHEIVVDVRRDHAATAVGVLEVQGYERVNRWAGGAERSFWRTAHEIRLLRTGSTTMVVRLRWAAPGSRSVVGRLLRPTPADWAAVDLPVWAWPAYPLVRLARLGLERLGRRSADHSALEPFLSTPTELIPLILAAVDATHDDVVADLGCGDGRVVIDAARRLGCRAIGVEQIASLVERARADVEAAGLGDRVTIVHGDADDLGLDDVTIVVLFLPISVASVLVPRVLRTSPPGTRIVLHEQSAIGERLPTPDRSVPIVGDAAMTVAHIWTTAHPSPPTAP